ncbi:hypothetical protein [Candidatus Mesenet endosymbiont of Phosphuga atrata]|uniref:hypothetical protein n=1 Tax=Candidatus Mesenet endosymbiont of Phosphuga atrata TaxID=3066221 RepID=UPI0030D03562
MYNNMRKFNVDDIEIEVFGKNPSNDQIESIGKSIDKAFNNFNAAFCNDLGCGGAQKINIYAANTEGEYKELLNEKEIDNSIKNHKFSALKDYGNKEFDIYFYLNRSGDFAYSTLERAVARVLIEGNDVFKSALPQALKTGMVDYVAGLDENGDVQDNNEDCRDFNKIIGKNLSLYKILSSKNSEAQAEQVIKYLKQENPDKINQLFKDLTNTQNQQDKKTIADNFLNELKNDDEGLNSKFSEWISKQLEQFQQKLAEKFVPEMESVTMKDGTEIVVRYHQDSKMKDVKTSVADTLTNFKDAFCSNGECNIPQKLNIFSFNSETDYSQYLCSNNKKSDKFFVSNDKNGGASIYLYLKGKGDNKESNNIDTLNARVIEAIMKNNDWDHLPQKFREGVQNYILDLNDDGYKNSNLNDTKNSNLAPGYIMSEFGTEGYLSGQVVRFLMENKSDDAHQLLKSFNELQVKDKTKVEKIVSSFMGKLDGYEQGFSDWVKGQLSQVNNARSEEELNPLIQIQERESTSMDQIQEQSTEGKQDFIDQVMNSSCITDLGIKPECKDKLEDLIKALKECNEESEKVVEPNEPEEETGEKPEEETREKPEEETREKPEEEITKQPEEEITEQPEEGVVKESKESISDIFNNFRKALCNSQECHGIQKVNISTISGDEFRDLVDEPHYNKVGYFIISDDHNIVDIKLYIDHEKDSSALNFGSGTFINPHCNSYVPSDLNIGNEYESNCAKAAQVMSFLIQRHPDHLVYLFEDLAKSGCENGDRIMQELDNYYNSELQT